MGTVEHGTQQELARPEAERGGQLDGDGEADGDGAGGLLPYVGDFQSVESAGGREAGGCGARGRPSRRRARAIRRSACSRTLHNLALIHRTRGDTNEAIRLHTQAIAVLEPAVTAHHPTLTAARRSLAALVSAPGPNVT
ncbi:tetratricopeptide repeat protein [Streptomyces sp. NPDC050355]|uniref:tetratricopeptide repeat protein n=1 Tax=Streptomyces sp. NPDC050355 TaxID=3365609 RepID=UPI0037AFFF42